MNKTAIFISVVLVSGFVSFKMMDFRFEEPFEAWAEEQRVEDTMVSYQCFKLTFEATLADLKSGEIQLKDAYERIYSVARLHRPQYLFQLRGVEPGRTDEERVAHNLVAHISTLEEFYPNLRERTLDLKSQLQVLLDELRSAK